MHAAPAVSVRCTGGWVLRGATAALVALAAGSLAAWGVGHAGGSAAAAVPVALAVGLFALRRAAPSPTDLAWDGQAWTADGRRGRIVVMIDLGPWMLLRLRSDTPPASALWLPVSAAEAGASWHALRAAAYARAPQVAPAAAGTPVSPD